MVNNTYSVREKVVIFDGPAAWHFVHIPKTTSADIKKKFGAHSRGWSSLRVTVTLGKTKWNTSIFYDRRSQGYLLPLKAEVRKKEGIAHGDTIRFAVSVRV